VDYSSFDWKWAVRLANRGYNAKQIADLLRRKPRGNRDPYSLKYMRILEHRGLARAEAYAMRTAARAAAWVKVNPPIRDPSAGRAALAEIRDVADSLDWLVYGGPGPRRVLEGLFVVGDRLGSVSFRLANRAWAELVGMTVTALLRRRASLLNLGWVVRNPRDRQGRTARYVLRIPDKIEWYASAESAARGGLEEEVPGRPEALVNSSGGGSAFEDLSSGGLRTTVPFNLTTPCEVNGTALLGHDAFRSNALGDLGWYAVTRQLRGSDLDGLLDRLAVEYGTAGALDRDIGRHRRDREEFRRDHDE
jgi:hypothetical protein